MERRLIRKRWQVTIPRSIRQRLNLFIGQTLNFDLADDFTIRLFTGSFALSPEETAFREVLMQGGKGQGRRKRLRKSDRLKTSREKLIAEGRSLDPEREELGELVSSMSQYLLALQKRLKEKKDWEVH